MKTFGIMAVCVASGLAWQVASANDAAEPKNPYATIAARNAFGLLSPALPPVVPPAEVPPPRIQLTGTMSIFGREQVLFRVLTREDSPGARSVETFYVLAEGEQKDGVGVVNVDVETGMVTFNNHGVVQQIPLAQLDRSPSVK